MSLIIPIEDIDRRNTLESQGLQFRDRDRPYEIVLNFDIPTPVMNRGYIDLVAVLVNKLTRAIRRGRFPYTAANPPAHCVRVEIEYATWDLDLIVSRGEENAMLILYRIRHLVRARSAWERTVHNTLPMVPTLFPFYAVRIMQFYDLADGEPPF